MSSAISGTNTKIATSVDSLTAMAALPTSDQESGDQAYLHNTSNEAVFILVKTPLPAIVLAQLPAGFGVASNDGVSHWLESDFYYAHLATINGVGVFSLTIQLMQQAFKARNIVSINVDPAAYAVASATGNDFVAGGNIAGDTILLTNNTIATQDGPWVVGPVDGGGNAPLSRPNWWLGGLPFFAGTEISVFAGTKFAGSTWKVFATGVVDAVNPDIWPAVCKGTGILGSSVAGEYIVGSAGAGQTDKLYLRSAESILLITRGATNNAALTVEYKADPATFTLGRPATSAATIIASLANATGTVNVADTSGITWEAVNFS